MVTGKKVGKECEQLVAGEHVHLLWDGVASQQPRQMR